MSESWMERVEAKAYLARDRDVVPLPLAIAMAEKLDADDDDRDVGRLLREMESLGRVQVVWDGEAWAGEMVKRPRARVQPFWLAIHEGRGPDPLAALQALAEAVKE